ncbi:MAG: aminotransferase class V-fold PLP-dependent enzyme [Bacteroidota bacterium]
MQTTSTSSIETIYNVDQFRTQGHELIDMLSDYLSKMLKGDEVPVLPNLSPDTLYLHWNQKLKEQQIFHFPSLIQDVLDQSLHLHHPRNAGHQVSSPAPLSVLASLVSDLLNNGMAVYETGPASSVMDRIVIEEVNKVIGYGPESDGIITSGGTLSNLTALLAARAIQAPDEVWTLGTQKKYALMVSEEAHYCVDRAARVMGWGDEGIIKIPTDDQFRMQVAQLPRLLSEARDKGIEVLAVVGSACTTSTGTYDPLNAIADFCEKENIWFHVDGAHGGAAAFSPTHTSKVKGIHRADSITLDFHKMMMVPALTTGLLFKNSHDSYRTFSQKAQYLWAEAEEREWYNMAKRTFECTKRMVSLPVYTMMKAYGMEIFGEYVDTCYALAQTFAAMIQAEPQLELAVEPQANIVCFRFVSAGLSPDQLDALNREIRVQIVESGTFYIVQTQLRGRHYLRTTFMQAYTQEEDLQQLIALVCETGKKLTT